MTSEQSITARSPFSESVRLYKFCNTITIAGQIIVNSFPFLTEDLVVIIQGQFPDGLPPEPINFTGVILASGGAFIGIARLLLDTYDGQIRLRVHKNENDFPQRNNVIAFAMTYLTK